MDIKNIPIDELKPYKANPKAHPKDQIEKIAKSIQEFGWQIPVVIDKSKSIVAGHGRYLAAKKLGLKSVPVIEIKKLSKAKIKAFRIADNKVAESKWLPDYLAQELQELQDLNFDLDLTGFSGDELSRLLGDLEKPDHTPTPQTDKAEELQKKWGTKLGQIWQIGSHRLMCGDATKDEDVDRLMAGERAEILFTDPPYLMKFKGSPTTRNGYQPLNAKHKDILNDDLDRGESGIFLSRIALTIRHHVVGSYYIFFYHLGVEKIINALMLNGLNYKSLIIWYKNNLNLSNSDYKSIYEPIVYGWNEKHNFYGRKGTVDVITAKRSQDGNPLIGIQGSSVYLKAGKHYYKFERLKRKPKHFIEVKNEEKAIFNLFSGENDIWEVDKIKKNDLHPTMKPLDLAKRAILNSSKENEIVFDMFLGSGTTMISAEQLNRVCYGMEIEPKNVAVSLQLMTEMGLEPKLIQHGAER